MRFEYECSERPENAMDAAGGAGDPENGIESLGALSC